MKAVTTKRNIVAVWYRNNQPIWKQSYARIDTALPRATFHTMHKAQPLDVIAFHHAETGLELGWIKAHAGGKITSKFIWD